MIKKIAFITLFSIVFNSFSQEKDLPQGWDKIILDGKPAYMNLITGDVITKIPTKPALKKKEVVEYDPTQNHIVAKGETLSSIARKYNLSLAQIYRLNNVENFDVIKVGQEIVIGYKEKNDNSSNIETQSNNIYHTVKSGETLYRISKKYSVSVVQLKSLNNLTNNTISVGQQLIIE